MTLKEIEGLIKTSSFVIYGNGFIARRFFKQIKMLRCETHVSAVASTKLTSYEIAMNGNPVLPIETIDRNTLVFIATHDNAANEMKKYAEALGFTRVICIYHYLFDMEIGEPIEKNVSVNVRDLIINLRSGCLPAIYYLSLRDYLGINKYDGSIYKRAYMHFTTPESAVKRWERFTDRINQFESIGFSQDYNVKVSKDFCLMDGLHRLILAKYYGVKTLCADVYDCDGEYFSENIFGSKTLIKENDLEKYYSPMEICEIEHADELLKE